MATGTGYRPGDTALAWTNQVWARMIDRAAYEKQRVRQLIKQLDAPHRQLNVPMHENLTPTQVSGSTDLYEPTFSSNTETARTYTPVTWNLNVALDERTPARMLMSPESTLRESIEMALAQRVDTSICDLFPTLVTNTVGSYAANLTLADVLSAQSKVMVGAKEFAEMGKYIFVYHYLQNDDIMQINNLVTWTARGEGNNAARTGQIGEGYGIRFVPVGTITSSGGGFNNAMFIERAMGIGFNIPVSVKAQEHGRATWLLGLGEWATGIQRDAYACQLRSLPT